MAQAFAPLVLIMLFNLGEGEIPIAAFSNAARRRHKIVAWHYLAHRAINRFWRRYVTERKVIGKRLIVDLARDSATREKRLQLRTKRDLLAVGCVKQGFLPDTITGKKQLAITRIPYRNGEHASELCEAPFRVVFKKVHNRFGV